MFRLAVSAALSAALAVLVAVHLEINSLEAFQQHTAVAREEALRFADGAQEHVQTFASGAQKHAQALAEGAKKHAEALAAQEHVQAFANGAQKQVQAFTEGAQKRMQAGTTFVRSSEAYQRGLEFTMQMSTKGKEVFDKYTQVIKTECHKKAACVQGWNYVAETVAPKLQELYESVQSVVSGLSNAQLGAISAAIVLLAIVGIFEHRYSRKKSVTAEAAVPPAAAVNTMSNAFAEVMPPTPLRRKRAESPTPTRMPLGELTIQEHSAANAEHQILQTLNMGNQDDLMALKGIGLKSASRIMQYREQHGELSSVSDLTTKVGLYPTVVQRFTRDNCMST